MMDELIKTLRADWPEILVEKHWMMDSDAIEKQRSEAADAIEVLRERVKRVENNNRELRGSKERVYAATDLRQPTQSDALLTKLLKECLVKLRDVQGRKPPKEYACNLIKRIERVLQEQSK